MNTLCSSLRAARLTLLALSLTLVSHSVSAQLGPAGGAGTKGGKDVACDGALEIVPTKQVTFLRKRRPPTAQPAAAKGATAKPSGGAAKRRG
jgi:hypothetical protein